MLDLALTGESTPQTWDEEAFAVEIGRRHGPAARGVVEALVSWAEQKERELAAAAGVTAKVLTRFPTNGVTAEPELMFPVDIQVSRAAARPRSRSTQTERSSSGSAGCATRRSTSGPAAKSSEIRSTSRGIHVHSHEANGWPRFPIRCLENRENLHRLVALLDRVSEESHGIRPTGADWPEGNGHPARTMTE